MKAPYSIRKLRHRPGTLYVDFRIDGKRHVIALDTLDKQVARLKAAEVYARFADPARQVGGRVTVDEFLAEYRAWRIHQKGERSITSEDNALRSWLAFNTVQRVEDISPRDVDRYIQYLSSKPAMHGFRGGKTKPTGRVLSPSTVRSYVCNLRTVFSMARRWRYCSVNPFSDVPLPKFEKPRPRTYSVAEIRAILRATAQHSPECLDLFLVYLLTGMRVGEAMRLQWSDVHFDQGILELKKTKGKKIRFVPMGPLLRSIFERRRALSRPFDSFTRSATRVKRVRKFDVDFVGKEWSRMAAIAGVPNAQLKRTRGTYATALLEIANVSPLGVQTIVGHADIATTQAHYFNPLSDDIMRKVPAIDAMFEDILPAELDNRWITPIQKPSKQVPSA